MSSTIDYLDAWHLWLAGSPVPVDLWMGPMTIRWWGRAGKIAAFIGGATVVLDLIGADRLRKLGRSNAKVVQETNDRLHGLRQRNRALWRSTFFAAACAVYVVGVFIVNLLIRNGNATAILPLVAIVAIGLGAVFAIGPRVLMWILDRREPALVLRYVAIGLLMVGFHLDLLAFS